MLLSVFERALCVAEDMCKQAMADDLKTVFDSMPLELHREGQGSMLPQSLVGEALKKADKAASAQADTQFQPTPSLPHPPPPHTS